MNRPKPDWPAGMYISLYHGRTTPDQPMDDWGFDGPVIGPCNWIHVTYMNSIRMEFQHSTYASAVNLLQEDELDVVDDLVSHNGNYYGDWEVLYHTPETQKRQKNNSLPTLSG